MYLLLYVDEVLMVGSDQKTLLSLADRIGSLFNVQRERRVNMLLGLISEDIGTDTIIRSVSTVKRMLHQFKIQSCRSSSTPFPSGLGLDKTQEPADEEERTEMGRIPYRELVGSLLYLANTTRPDIAYVVGLLCR